MITIFWTREGGEEKGPIILAGTLARSAEKGSFIILISPGKTGTIAKKRERGFFHIHHHDGREGDALPLGSLNLHLPKKERKEICSSYLQIRKREKRYL